MEKTDLLIGKNYYMVQQSSPEAEPEITTFVYGGLVDDRKDTHFFTASGLSKANIFLHENELNYFVDYKTLASVLAHK